MQFIVAYDISNQTGRTRVAKLFEKYEGHRVQKSVFVFDVTKKKLNRILSEAKTKLAACDSLRCWQIDRQANSQRYPELAACQSETLAGIFDGRWQRVIDPESQRKSNSQSGASR